MPGRLRTTVAHQQLQEVKKIELMRNVNIRTNFIKYDHDSEEKEQQNQVWDLGGF
jgi:hypothetical protein